MSRARAVLIENVSGLVTRHPEAFHVVLEAMRKEGWLVAWTILDAANYGVPQHRKRVFVVGFREESDRLRFQWPLPSHAPPGDLLGRPPYRTVREALSLGDTPHRKGPKENAKPGQLQGMRLLDVDAPFDLLDRVTATEQKSAMSGSQLMARRRRASERLSEALGALDRPSPVITAGGTEGGGGAEPIANRDQRRELHDAIEAAGLANRPATTVQGDPRLAVAGHHDRQQNGAVRLSVEQCALLQGFPPGWTWEGTKSSQHRQIGNAVPPQLAEAIGRALKSALF